MHFTFPTKMPFGKSKSKVYRLKPDPNRYLSAFELFGNIYFPMIESSSSFLFSFFFKQQKGRESNHKSISNAITQSLVFIDTFARITFSILHAFLCYFYYDKLLFSIESDILSILPYGLIETGLFQSYLIEPAQFQTDQSSKCIEAWYQSYPKLLRI